MEAAQVAIENIEDNKRKLTFGVDKVRFEEGVRFAYNKNKGRINVPGFRKGKAPRQIIEMHYGKEVFYEDAVNFIIDDAYVAAAKESGLEIIAKPELDVEDIGEDGVVFTAIVYTRPEIALGEYKGLEYTAMPHEVTEEDIEEVLKKDQEKNSRIVSIEDRPVASGDTVDIDFVGYIDDEAFPGGEAEGFELLIGSKQFIDTFEEQLIGANIGETVQVNVTFPEQYHAADLAGRPVRFEVVINRITLLELPNIDDELAQDVSEYDTLDEYRENIREEMAESKIEKAKHANEEAVLDALLELTTIDIPQAAINDRTDELIRDFSMQLNMSGISPMDYMRFTGQDVTTIRNNYFNTAKRQLEARFLLLAVAKAEGLDVTDEERQIEVERLSDEYDIPVEQTQRILDSEQKVKELTEDILTRKALDVLMEAAVAV